MTLLLAATGVTAGAAAENTFASTQHQTQLIELYTSQGCSSCPPADAWLSQLRQHPKLWQEIVPVAFHVDYWDYLGWKDPFANPQHGSRQRQAARRVDAGVYTPGVFSNQQEWRKWRRNPNVTTTAKPKAVGTLSGNLTTEGLHVTFQPSSLGEAPLSSERLSLQVDAVMLQTNQATRVLAGENRGRQLQHDFIASQLTSAKLDFADGAWSALLPITRSAESTAIAFWVADHQGNYLQATGGWLSQ